MQTTARTQPVARSKTYRILRILAWGIAITISTCLVLVWIAFFVYVFWAVINS